MVIYKVNQLMVGCPGARVMHKKIKGDRQIITTDWPRYALGPYRINTDVEVLGFCLMGNHFHILVRMQTGDGYDDEEIKRRFKVYYEGDEKRHLADAQIPYLRKKWSNLSEYVKEIKQGFSRFYNRLHKRKGFFWSERFKSLIVENGETLINCLAYIDLNPIRAGIAERPEQYRWSSLGYHAQAENKDGFLSLDFGLREFGVKNEKERLHHYREFVYKMGGIETTEKERDKGFEGGGVERFLHRTRYFTDSGIIGTKSFVNRLYQRFKRYFFSRHEKQPKTIKGLDGIYSLKRLCEYI